MNQPEHIVVNMAVFRVKRLERKTAHPTPARFLDELARDLYLFCLCLTEQTDIYEIEFSPDHPYNQDVVNEANSLLKKRGFELELRWSTDPACQKSGQLLVIRR